MNREEFQKEVLKQIDVEAIAVKLIKGDFIATDMEITRDWYGMETEVNMVLPEGVEITIKRTGVKW
jgi:hypothetical protein